MVVIDLIVLSVLCAFVIVTYFIKLLGLCFAFKVMLLWFVFDYLGWYFRFVFSCYYVSLWVKLVIAGF